MKFTFPAEIFFQEIFFFHVNLKKFFSFQKFKSCKGLFKKEARIIFLGLENAGKTTMLRFCTQSGKLSMDAPTLHPNREEFTVGNVTFSTTDMGGHEEARRIWRDNYMFVHGILFMIDAADKEKLSVFIQRSLILRVHKRHLKSKFLGSIESVFFWNFRLVRKNVFKNFFILCSNCCNDALV